MLSVLEPMPNHTQTGLVVRQRNVNPPLEPPPYGRVQSPRQISGSQNKNPIVIVTQPLHLHEKLSLHSPGSLVLTFRTIATH